MPRLSQWSFETSSSLGVSGTNVGIEYSRIYLNDPSRAPFMFDYKATTFGISIGPKSSQKLTVNGSSEKMDSDGLVFMMDNFRAKELARSDFEGFCMFDEGTLTFKGFGVSALLLWVGIPMSKIPFEAANSPVGLGVSQLVIPGLGIWGKVVDLAIESSNLLPRSIFEQGAKAIIVMAGQSASSKRSFSVAGGIGIVSSSKNGEVNLYVKTSEDPNPVDRTTVHESVPIPADILFDFDKSDLKQTWQTEVALWTIARRIQLVSPPVVYVLGFTDSIGDYGYNLRLSKARAETIRRWFVNFGIVKSKKIVSEGYSWLHPIDVNSTIEGRAKNRRVEILF